MWYNIYVYIICYVSYIHIISYHTHMHISYMIILATQITVLQLATPLRGGATYTYNTYDIYIYIYIYTILLRSQHYYIISCYISYCYIIITTLSLLHYMTLHIILLHYIILHYHYIQYIILHNSITTLYHVTLCYDNNIRFCHVISCHAIVYVLCYTISYTQYRLLICVWLLVVSVYHVGAYLLIICSVVSYATMFVMTSSVNSSFGCLLVI